MVPVISGKDTKTYVSKSGQRQVQASTIHIARLLPPLKKYKGNRIATGNTMEVKTIRGPSRERPQHQQRKKAPPEKSGNQNSRLEDFADSEDQPSRESLVALVQQSQVFDEVATRRELHFLIRSLIR